jgi:hypothetical protein
VLPILTNHQRQALDESSGGPVYLVDQITLQKYVLVDADAFEQFLDVVFEHDDAPQQIR